MILIIDKSKHFIKAITLLTLLFFLLPLSEAPALINPNFTPVELLNQSDLVVVLSFDGTTQDGKLKTKVTSVLKGTTPEKTMTIDLATAGPDVSKVVRQLIFEGANQPILLFSGSFEESDPGTTEMEMRDNERKAFMYVGTSWITLYGFQGTPWEMDKISAHMLGTWNGGPDMLLCCVKYVLSDENARMPVRTDELWSGKDKIGSVKGAICAMQALNLTGTRAMHLFVGCETGDRLYTWNIKAKIFDDVTDSTGLKSKSKAATWADFDGNGILDLLSWNGVDLVLYSGNDDGKYRTKKLGVSDYLKDGCIDLDVVGYGAKGLPAVIVSTSAMPMLCVPDKVGKTKIQNIAQSKAPEITRTENASGCLVADFDADGMPDIIQPFETEGLFYKGTALGVFASPVSIPVALGEGGIGGAFIGDFDADGRFDVFCATENGRRLLWHNYSNMKFVETFKQAGEVSYMSKTGVTGGMTGDINNDGQQDFLLIYSSMPAQVFFNRGFRSFGHAHSLTLSEGNILPEANDGQQSGLFADLNGDGDQDMALVLTNGDIWVLRKRRSERFSLTVSLPLTGLTAGPITVLGEVDNRSMGAWNVVPGTSRAFIGTVDPGPVTITWRLPGGLEQKKEVIVEKKSQHFVITK